MKVRIIVPRRGDDGERDRLWYFCAGYWRREFPPYEICEGHHYEGPFNRSAAINKAAIGEWDVAVILDGDVIVDVDQIERAVQLAAESGELVIPFRRRRMVNAKGTRQILRGYQGAWDRFVYDEIGVKHVSSCIVVPRALWDDVGGFDERFEGWGGEDDAFHAACRVLSGVRRLPGAAWHLHHARSRWRDWKSPLYRQARLLSDRYVGIETPDGMRRLLAEGRGDDQVAVVVLTNGSRPRELGATLRSAQENLHGPIGRWIVCFDGMSANARRFATDDVDIVPMGRSRGYGPAVARALDVAIGSGQPWIFWLEDDFTFDQPVDLAAMQALMGANPHLAQLSLKRQAWYGPEVDAGGIFEAKPEAFTERDGYVEHRDYWTMNPMLCRRAFLAEHKWPKGTGSERRFGRQVFSQNGYVGGVLGALADPPRVTHIGPERAGHGY